METRIWVVSVGDVWCRFKSRSYLLEEKHLATLFHVFIFLSHQFIKFRRHLAEMIHCEETEAEILHNVEQFAKQSREMSAVS